VVWVGSGEAESFVVAELMADRIDHERAGVHGAVASGAESDQVVQRRFTAA